MFVFYYTKMSFSFLGLSASITALSPPRRRRSALPMLLLFVISQLPSTRSSLPLLVAGV